MFLWPGLSVATTMIGGWRIVPLLLATVLTIPHLEHGLELFTQINWHNGLRQVGIYGGAGLLLHPRWRQMPQRLSLHGAIFLVLVAALATTASAFLVLASPPLNLVSGPERSALFLSFWGADFAGLMLGMPGAVLLWYWLQPQLKRNRLAAFRLKPESSSTRAMLGLLAFALGLSLLSLLPPWLGAEDANLGILILLAVLLGGLMHGVRIAYFTALLVCSIQLAASVFETGPAPDVLDLQLLLVMSVTTGLLAGAAHDDKLHEWQLANFDPLTGLANRHRFHDRLEQGMVRAAR